MSLSMKKYLQHPHEKVTSDSHSMMVSFGSSGSDADQDDRAALKDRFAFYYIKRSLEVVHLASFFQYYIRFRNVMRLIF